MTDMVQLMEYLLDWFESQDMEVVLVQAWLIWNQRNKIVHRGKFQDSRQSTWDTWQPPPPSVFKLNFDAVLFSTLNSYGFGAVIRNEKGEVMAVMAAKGPVVFCSEEAELLACRKSIEFAVDARFSELVIERDNSFATKAISAMQDDHSMLGNVIGDIHHLIGNLQWVRIECTRRGGNMVAHELAQFARNISHDLFWMEDVPPKTREALYQDSNFF
ncbi:hypothetical protein SO802_031955 [Lithocarpus litseifolius]|uniref:RNase H type-1 domain-containing protein n=1 Tax=Lithocarpus litseifolius TaxID=425828 RepID=A0AAW2BQC6_9ROSI